MKVEQDKKGLEGLVNDNIQQRSEKRSELLSILDLVCRPSNGLCFEKKVDQVADVAAQGTTV